MFPRVVMAGAQVISSSAPWCARIG